MMIRKSILIFSILGHPFSSAEIKCIQNLEVTLSNCNYDRLLLSIEQKLNYPDRLMDEIINCPHSAADELLLHLPSMNTAESAVSLINDACSAAKEAYSDYNEVPWSEVTQKGNKFDKEFFDGNGDWNEQHQTNYPHEPSVPGEPSNVLSRDAERVDDLHETNAKRYPLQWPGDSPTSISNFENCELQSVMCCWVSDRQANDNNGNCATPYDSECLDADPADNTDLCAVDMSRSLKDSSHVDDGFAIFPLYKEGPTHCHGFAWGEDNYEASYRYRANNLFSVSMSDHLHNRGYVRAVQGAPMCACVENMPIVTRADCTEISAKEFYNFTFNDGIPEATLYYVDVDFNACQGTMNNDLQRHYERLLDEGRVSREKYDKFRQTVVGYNGCGYAVSEILFSRGYTYRLLQNGDFKQEEGACVKFNGEAQMHGVVKIGVDMDYGPSEDKTLECLDICATYSEKMYITGCEAVWNGSNRGCYIHTYEVRRGNGDDMHTCWIVK